MADNVAITAGSGTTVAADEVVDGTLGTVKVQYVKIMDGTLDGTTKASVGSGGLAVSARTSDSLGQAAYNFPAGFVRTSDEPHQIFYDPFDAALDTTNTWTTPTVGNSASLAAVSAGSLNLGTGTTASGWSKIFSLPTFKPVVPGWLGFSFAIALPDGAAPTSNAYRFWGSGTPATTPTTAAPLTDAVGFELTTAGRLCAVVYASGTRTLVADLGTIGGGGTGTQPTDALPHRYVVYVRTDRAYWYIDSLATPAATSTFQAPSIQTLPVTMLAVGGSTPPVSNTQIQCTGLAVWDTAKNTVQLADGTYPWRKMAISSTGGLTIGTLPAIPAGTNVIGHVISDTGSTTAVTQATASALNATVTQQTLTKGTQGATGVSTQDLKDAGRALVTYYTVIPVLTSATDTLQSLTGTKAGATVAPTTTPAVVTTGKTFRIQKMWATYVATATSGYGIVRLRYNTGGVVAVTSPVLIEIAVGAGTPGTANSVGTVEAPITDGLELAAGTGVGLSVQGFTAVTATAVGYVLCGITGYEY